ncbi:DUF3148 domain-containing protein [Oxynema sp. CENA135]|uniref:regulatory protein SipA n=1 Tax=Oxynema sp. CENA135 TaxID=984206 RepID=UPI001909F410|nr:DUF3148 domain-containing protein [Oxynema sp. CENA135]MBK4729308.1 DUF3148 domain-containing protein [Oxynema sp. CENA135]
MSKAFEIGDRVRLTAVPPYFKTAEPTPMLRPPNVVRLGEEGTILDRQPGDYWSVRFEKGAYLIENKYIDRAVEQPTGDDPARSNPSSDELS